MKFKWGQFFARREYVNVASNMRYGELIKLEYVNKLYGKEI